MTSITSTATIGSMSEAQTMKSKVSGPVLASSVADQTVIANISTKTAAISPSELTEIKPSTTATLRDYKQALTSPLPRMASINSTAIIGGMSEAPTMKPKVSGPVLASSAADQTVIANLSTNTAASSSIGTETKPSAKATSSNFHQGQTMSLPRMTSLTSAAATSGMNEATSIMSTMSGIRLASSVADVAVIANLVPNTESKWSRWSSWTDCTKTCGTGTRQRNRTCDAINQRAVFAPISCAGKAQQVKSCAEWSCPDCNRTCIKGTLNDECDACTCDDHVLTGRVLSETNVPLPEANISLAETPYRVLAQTNISGYFTAFNVCTDVKQELFISKAGFVPTKKNATSLTLTTANVVAKLEIAVPPFVTVHPESKMRMPGQSVTFCCEGEGNPPPEIEWFKENNIIDKDLYSYNNTLLIPAVDNGLSGTYRCRVVNDFGSEFSDTAVLKVLDKEKDSCSPIPNSKNVTLPDGCVTRVTNSSSVDVGECEPVACLRNDSTFNSSCQDPSFCCGPRDVKYVLVDCGDIMSFNLSKVTRCSCGGCTEKVTIVNGIVVGGSEEKPIKYGDVIYGGEVVAYTDGEGRFSLTIPQKVKRAIVTFQDFDQEFEERTKVFVLNEGSTAFHKIKLKSVPAPITFNASEPIDIPLGSDPNNGSFADLELSEGSFLTEDGSVFQGNAKATISVTDSRNLSDVLTAPGDFTTTDEEGEAEILETYGMVKLKFEDKSGKPLAMSKPMKVYLDPQKLNLTVQNANDVPLKLYWLDKKTERWREVGNFQLGDGSKRRRKRSNRIFFVGTVTPAIAQEKLNFDLPAVRVAVRVTTDPYPRTPNGADVLVRVIRQEYGFYRGYIEETTSAEGLVCIPIWRDKTCHIQAETNGKYMIPTRIDDLPPNIEAQPRSDDVNGDIQWIEFKSELGETSNNPTPMYKHIPAEVAKCKSPQVRPEGSQFTFQEPPTVSDFSILNNNDINWVNRGCYIKIKVNGENAIFAAESYKEDDTGETGKIGWHIRMSRTVTAGGSNIVCLQFSCPRNGAYTYLKVAPLTRQCTFRAGSVHDDLSRVQYPHCPNEFTRRVCPVQPPAIRGQEKWLWIPKNGAAQTSYGTFSHPRFGDFRCLAGDQDYMGRSPTRVTEDGYALIYDCS